MGQDCMSRGISRELVAILVELPVLDDGGAARECVKERAT